ncbi:hypothetical protein E4U17_007212 [Claviceps sp. LM77 group G4]|nr:hypothetical protein E4U17_007212 [Claviceps sp. LM77 group G4]KAG6060460.1 hypothetical protein E4U33_006932 [Claviceps sp. LM78 group G4]KAG6080574.1 hypothetical protein E4U16_000217 [Claviceps sp. LM84 group G4]
MASSRRHEQRPHLASAVSRLSLLSHSERYRQFPVDSSSYVPRDEFPIFAHTGDVEITIRGAIAVSTYLLHRNILARCSGFFAASTSPQWSKAQPDSASRNERARDIDDDGDQRGGDKDGGGSAQNAFGSTRRKRRWKYELNHGTVCLDEPMLAQIDPSSAQQEGSGRAGGSQPSSPSLPGPGSERPVASHMTLSSLQHEAGPPAMRNASQSAFEVNPKIRRALLGMDQADLRKYDNLFRIFYNCRPMLDNVDVFGAFRECDFLLRLADKYDALAIVRPCVEHHLLQFQSKLWVSVARHTECFFPFGFLVRSKVIFKEALIHIVGKWYLSQQRPHLDVPDFVLDIAEDKVYELQKKVRRVTRQLFRLSLMSEEGEPVGPAKDYLDWLVVSLFRQWLVDNIKPQMWPACNENDSDNDSDNDNDNESERESESDNGNGNASDESNALIQPTLDICQVYRILGSDSPSAFLDHNDCEAFLALKPRLHTAEILARFEQRMTDLKDMARYLVRPLLHNSLELDLASPNISKEISDRPFYFTCTTVEDDDIPWLLEPYIPVKYE